jgi:streptomycin 6-kinase
LTPPVPDIVLPNGITIPGSTVRQFLWGDRDAGIAWARTIPDVLRDWCERERVTLSAEIPFLSMNLVLFGVSEQHGPVVLKASPPHPEVSAEIDALRHHSDPAIVGLIRAEPEISIMMQRRIVPGTTLKDAIEAGELSERDAVEVGASLMQRFWVEPSADAGFIALDNWFRALYDYRATYPNGGGPIPHDHVLLAIRQADELLATQHELVTLHGDVHHYNTLRDEDHGWTLIDPKGLVGERGYDIGTWLLNPIHFDRRPDVAEMTEYRLSRFSELLGIDRTRLWKWAMAHAVLSDCWNVEGVGTADAHLHAHATATALAAMPEADS